MVEEANTADKAKMPIIGCPFRGSLNDPETRMSFVTIGTCCHKSIPVSAISLEHQASYCLTEFHVDCPLYQANESQPMPDEFVFIEEMDEPYSKLVWLVPLVATLVVIAAFLLWRTVSMRQPPAAQLLEVTSTPAEVVAAVLTETPEEPTALPTSTLPPPTDTPESTATAQPTDTPVLTATPEPTDTPIPTATAVPTEVPTQAPTESSTEVAVAEPTATVAAPTSEPEPASAEGIPAVVSQNRVRARRGPDVAFSIVEQFEFDGQAVTAIGRTEDGVWLQLCCFNDGVDIGWIPADFLTVDGDTNDLPVADAPPPIAIVLVETLNIRSGPQINYDIVSRAKQGDRLEVLAQNGALDWWQVRIGEQFGWVYNVSVEIDGLIENIPVEENLPPTPAP